MRDVSLTREKGKPKRAVAELDREPEALRVVIKPASCDREELRRLLDQQSVAIAVCFTRCAFIARQQAREQAAFKRFRLREQCSAFSACKTRNIEVSNLILSAVLKTVVIGRSIRR